MEVIVIYGFLGIVLPLLFGPVVAFWAVSEVVLRSNNIGDSKGDRFNYIVEYNEIKNYEIRGVR